MAVCSTATGDGLDAVRRLIWDLSGLIRVFCKPRGSAVSRDAVVLRRDASVDELAAALHRSWSKRVRAALVTGKSAKFPGQSVGRAHVLEDGDVVELVF